MLKCVNGYETVARPIDTNKHPNIRKGAKYYHACTHKENK